MAEETDVIFGAVIIVFFLWRFIRTHQLYRYSVRVTKGQAESVSVRPEVSRIFLYQSLFGQRDVAPKSFYVGALVFFLVTVILFPSKDYGINLYLIVLVLIAAYVPWCIGHGLLLSRRSRIN